MCLQPHRPSLHIAGPAWSPTNWQDYILHLSPEPSRQSPGAPGKDCACCEEWFQCHQQELEAVFPGYFQLENWFLVVELVTDPGTDKFQAASLKRINKYNTYNWYIAYNWYNNYHSQDCHMFPALIKVRIQRTWFQSLSVSQSRCKTRAYQTVSGDTTKAPLSIPGGLIMTMSKWWLLW